MKIENIFIINLDRRKDLLDKTKYIFNFINENYNINIIKITGIDLITNSNPLILNNLILNNIIDINCSGLRNNKNSVLGEIGCFLSHKKCWEKIINEKLENTLILEDGIIFNKTKFTDNILESNYDIIFTNKEMKKLNNYLIGYGLQSYILSNKGALKMLNNCKKLHLPIDLQIRHICNKQQLIWFVKENYFVERNNNRLSSISNDINNNINPNEKQNNHTIIIRIFKKFIK